MLSMIFLALRPPRRHPLPRETALLSMLPTSYAIRDIGTWSSRICGWPDVASDGHGHGAKEQKPAQVIFF